MPAKTKKDTTPVTLVGYQFRSMFNPKGKEGEKTQFTAKSFQSKDIANAIHGVRGLGLGIGCMVKVFKVDESGKESFVMTLFPQYKVSQTRSGTSVSVYAKPAVSYDETLALERTLPRY